jgi:hypothetical protein
MASKEEEENDMQWPVVKEETVLTEYQVITSYYQ